VRVFQDFATVDLLSGGRAEIMAGRGSFIESFPLFGYDLGDYDALFSDHLDLLLELRDSERVTWRGKHRAPIDDRGVYPRPIQNPLPVWIAVGGTPASVVRAGTLGLPLAIAIIGGLPIISRRSSISTARPVSASATTRPGFRVGASTRTHSSVTRRRRRRTRSGRRIPP